MQTRSNRKKDRGNSRPTLVDVASEAGVGTTTVSRVINGGHLVNAATIARVHAAIKRLEYQPNQAARALKAERTNTLGFIVPTLRDVFFAELADVAQKMSRQRGYILILLASEDNAEQEVIELSVFRSHRVDGILVVPPREHTRAFLASLSSLNVPIVAVDRPVKGLYSSVCCDNFVAAQAATEHLIEHGRKRILCLANYAELHSIKERVRGYEQAVHQAGLRSDVSYLASAQEQKERIRAELKRPIKQRADAIFTLMSGATIAAYEALENDGVRVPEDIALIGFDDFPLSTTLRPAVSVVRQPVEEIARLAMGALFEQLTRGSLAASHHVTVGTELLRRASCGCSQDDNS